MRNARSRNHVGVEGMGTQSMVLSHGFGCDQTVWAPMRPYLGPSYRFISYDLVGSGCSDVTAYDEAKYATLQGYAADLLEICHALELRDVVYVGHSVSAMIGCLAAVQEPTMFSNLILVAPSPCYQNLPGYEGGFSREQLDGILANLRADQRGWAQQVSPLFMNNPERPELTQDLCDRFCHIHPHVAGHFAQTVFLTDYRHILPRVTTPTLILQCSDDVVAPLCVGEYMRNAMPRSTLQILPSKGHFPHICAPKETAQAILGFLNSAL